MMGTVITHPEGVCVSGQSFTLRSVGDWSSTRVHIEGDLALGDEYRAVRRVSRLSAAKLGRLLAGVELISGRMVAKKTLAPWHSASLSIVRTSACRKEKPDPCSLRRGTLHLDIASVLADDATNTR